MMRYGAALAAALLFPSCLWAADAPVDEACSLMRRGGLQEALAVLDKALGLDPDHSGARLHRAVARAMAGDSKGSAADYRLTLKSPKGSSPAGGEELCDTRFAPRLEQLRAAREKAEAAKRRASSLFMEKKGEAAAKALTEAASHDPSDPEIFLSRAVVRESAGDGEGAVADYEEAILLSRGRPDFRAQALLGLSEALERAGRPGCAEASRRLRALEVERVPEAPEREPVDLLREIGAGPRGTGAARVELEDAGNVFTPSAGLRAVEGALAQGERLLRRLLILKSVAGDGPVSREDVESAFLSLFAEPPERSSGGDEWIVRLSSASTLRVPASFEDASAGERLLFALVQRYPWGVLSRPGFVPEALTELRRVLASCEKLLRRAAAARSRARGAGVTAESDVRAAAASLRWGGEPVSVDMGLTRELTASYLETRSSIKGKVSRKKGLRRAFEASAGMGVERAAVKVTYEKILPDALRAVWLRAQAADPDRPLISGPAAAEAVAGLYYPAERAGPHPRRGAFPYRLLLEFAQSKLGAGTAEPKNESEAELISGLDPYAAEVFAAFVARHSEDLLVRAAKRAKESGRKRIGAGDVRSAEAGLKKRAARRRRREEDGAGRKDFERIEDPLRRYQAALELLNEGKRSEAIEDLELLAELSLSDPAVRVLGREVRSRLATAYLRSGGLSACAEMGGGRGCLFPGGTQDLRTDKEGARRAVALYEELLQERPLDFRARWLLNLSHMALGSWPGEVPSRWLIPPEAFRSPVDVGRFPDRAAGLGIDTLGRAGGAILDDFDNDGFLDIVASAIGPEEPLKFFRSKGDGRFEDRTERAGVAGEPGGLYAVQADYDNDGLTDLFVARGGWAPRKGRYPDSLFRNLGKGVFEDVASRAGLAGDHRTQTALWADYDNDGNLDLLTGGAPRKEGEPAVRLHRGRGDGTFEEVAGEAGIVETGHVIGGNWGDFDNDGRVDLYLVRYGEPNALYRNTGPGPDGRWTFEDVTKKAGVSGPIWGFSAWFWDYDNDGWEDILVFDFPERPAAETVAADYLGVEQDAGAPYLYKNLRDGTFARVSSGAGLTRASFAMGANFGDIDNDGFLDFYTGEGQPDPRSVVPNRLYRNDGKGGFQDVTASAGAGLLHKGHGISFGDLDNDGDQDVYVTMGAMHGGDTGRNACFENPGRGRAWMTLVLEGRGANRSAIGARVRVLAKTPAGKREIHRTVGTGGSFGANSLQLEIGLGDAVSVESVDIRWPGGKKQRVSKPPMRRFLRIIEGRKGWRVLKRKRLRLGGR